MAESSLKINTKKNVRVRSVALPVEHGAWGFLFEPLVAAAAVAPSAAAVWLSLLFIGAFLLRQPLKIFISGRIDGRRNLPQTALALRFVVIYGVICGIGLAGSLFFAPPESFVPLALIAPLAIYQIYADAVRQSRQLLPELTGAVAVSSVAAVLALAGGWTLPAAFVLWGIFIARLIPSILYVKERLRLEKGKSFSTIPPIIAHFAAFGAVGILVEIDYTGWLTLLMFIILLGRAVLGLSPYRRPLKAMKIGIREVIYGVLLVLSVIVGHYDLGF